MATSTGSGSFSATITSAELQAAWVFIHNLLIAGGLIQTADTGQVTPGAAVISGVNNTASGYVIYRFADAKQATAPIFFAFELGRGGGANQLALWMTVGKSSNGAGVIGSQILARRQFVLFDTNSAGNGWDGCATVDGFWFRLRNADGIGVAGSGIFMLERAADASGATFKDDLNLFHHTPTGGNTNLDTLAVLSYADVLTYQRQANANAPTSTNNLSFGNLLMDVNELSGVYPSSGKPSIYPFYTWRKQGEIWGVLRQFAMCFDRDFTDSTTYSNLQIAGHSQSMIKLTSGQRFGTLGVVMGNTTTSIQNQRFLLKWQ